MLTREEYLADPCRAASIPYWKAVRIQIPAHMRILHQSEFDPQLLNDYNDTPFFRLRHELSGLSPMEIPAGFCLSSATLDEFSDHIRHCYPDLRLSPTQLRDMTQLPVCCPGLWIALRDEKSGILAATGIGELDRAIGEGTLEWIQVSPAYRKRGLGEYLVRTLLLRLQGQARFATVSGQCGNPTDPERLYRRCGFTGADIWHILYRKAPGPR